MFYHDEHDEDLKDYDLNKFKKESIEYIEDKKESVDLELSRESMLPLIRECNKQIELETKEKKGK